MIANHNDVSAGEGMDARPGRKGPTEGPIGDALSGWDGGERLGGERRAASERSFQPGVAAQKAGTGF